MRFVIKFAIEKKYMNKIILVDDHTLFREGIKLLIENEGFGEVIAEADNGQSFLDILKTQHPDLVILNMEMPMMDGVETTLKALQMVPNLKILVLTMLSEMANYLDILNAGAMGIVLKTSGKTEFEKAIKIVLNGENYYSYELLNQIMVKVNRKSQPKIEKPIQNSDVIANRDKDIPKSFVKV